MEKNVGRYDRAARFVIGAGLMVYGLKRQKKDWRRNLALTIAPRLLWTAFSQKCPVYNLLGIHTGAEAPKRTAQPVIEETSEESFPASDAPAWAGNR